MSRIDDFLLLLKKRFQLQIWNLDQTLPSYSSIKSSIVWKNDKIIYGFGDDKKHSLAALKSISEIIERVVVIENRISNSSGVATHLTPDFAKQNAYTELLERDAVMCHWLTKTPGRRFFPEFVDEPQYRKLFENLAEQKVEVCFAELLTYNGLKTTLCGVFGTSCENVFGVIFGIGCSPSLEHASIKAFLEVFSNLELRLSGKGAEPLSLAAFVSIQKPTPLNHYQLGLYPDMGTQARWIFETNEFSDFKAIHNNSMLYRILDTPRELENCPFVTVKCENNDVQQLFFGLADDAMINFERLSRFVGNKKLNVNRQIHLFG